MKIGIDTISNTNKSFNAGVKPRVDVNNTLKNNGFDIRIICLKNCRFPYLNRLIILKDFFKLIKGIKCSDTVILQYPLFFYNFFIEYISLKLLCKRCNNVIYLIHDIDYIRSGNNRIYDAKLLNIPKRLIVHTERMKQEVKEKLLKNNNVEIDCLFLFDYYSLAKMMSIERICLLKMTIAFAGNLKKSKFLDNINAISDALDWNLYGVLDESEISNYNKENVHYIGKFAPENPSILEAGWGLVWDGSTVETCDGASGNYLKFNSPHKCSLYLSRGIPLIVWKESALADYVEKQRIGIAVNSLYEIEPILSNLSKEDYKDLITNARRVGQDLRNGQYLFNLLKNL